MLICKGVAIIHRNKHLVILLIMRVCLQFICTVTVIQNFQNSEGTVVLNAV